MHLRMYSEYSIRDGACRIAGDGGAAAAAAALEMPALAITDIGNIFGALKFYEESAARGVKAIIGCEVRVQSHGGGGHLLLLCASPGGYVNLSKLLTAAYRDGGGKIPQLQPENAAGLIALSGARRGAVGIMLTRGDNARAEEEAEKLAAVFSNRFYLEMWRGDKDNDDNGDNHLAVQTAQLARRMKLPAVAAHPVQCSRQEDVEMLQARRCVAHNWKLGDNHSAIVAEPWLLPPQIMRARFADIPGAADNTMEIARRCNFAFETGKTHLPRIDDDESAAKQLARNAEQGLIARIGNITPQYRERLDEELRVINETGFDDYFLIVADFVKWAKNNNVPVGPGRGSGAGSLVAYVLDITTLDPIQHGLFFERFLNKARVSPPDFDIDFCARGRDRVIQYVAEKYGAGRVSQIVTFGAFGARGGVRDIGRILGHGYGFGDRLARMIPPEPDIKLEKALADSEKLRNEVRDNEEAKRIVALAQKVEGTPRSIGTHAGGVLIAPRPIPEFCPLYTADDGGALVSQFDMTDIEKTGLLKFDFLGLRTLTLLDHAEKHLRQKIQSGKKPFSIDNAPLDDARVFNLYGAGNTFGVFQCESGGMRRLMKELNPQKFEEITALMALYRPGPLNAGMADKFVKRKNGQQSIEYPHPATKDALRETYGVIVYQEQVMQIARQVAGYSLSEADLLRRAIGKKKDDEVKSQRKRFLDGAQKTMPKREAEVLFNQILSFAGYGFNKAHAAAYALLSYRTAYLKVHYPDAFYAAAMSVESDNTDRMKMYAREARQSGIVILPPDVNKSGRDFFAKGKAVRYGLGAVRGLGAGAVEDITKARGDNPFGDVFDMCARVSGGGQITQAAVRNLICAGALDDLHQNRAAAAAALPSAWAKGGEQSAALFGEKVMRKVDDGKKWTAREKLTEENLALGFCLSASFFSLYDKMLNEINLHRRKIRDVSEGDAVQIAGVLCGGKSSGGMRSSGFEILVVEDESGEADVRVQSNLLVSPPKKHQLLIIEGTAREGYGNSDMEITARKLWTLDDYLAGRARRLRLFCGGAANGEAARELSSLLAPVKIGDDSGCEVLISCKNKDDDFHISFGRGFRVSADLCAKLRAAAAVDNIKVECAGEFA